MRTITIMLVLVLALLSFGQAQQRLQPYTLINGETYVDATIDTTNAIEVGRFSRIALVGSANDSVKFHVLMDYRAIGTTTWSTATVTAGDTVIVMNNSGGSQQVLIRGDGVNRIAGTGVQARFRFDFVATNGTSTGRKYYVRMYAIE